MYICMRYLVEARMSGPANLVLRTVYLDPEMDEELRTIAFDKKTSKNDLIRSYLKEAMKKDVGTSVAKLFGKKSRRKCTDRVRRKAGRPSGR